MRLLDAMVKVIEANKKKMAVLVILIDMPVRIIEANKKKTTVVEAASIKKSAALRITARRYLRWSENIGLIDYNGWEGRGVWAILRRPSTIFCRTASVSIWRTISRSGRRSPGARRGAALNVSNALPQMSSIENASTVEKRFGATNAK